MLQPFLPAGRDTRVAALLGRKALPAPRKSRNQEFGPGQQRVSGRSSGNAPGSQFPPPLPRSQRRIRESRRGDRLSLPGKFSHCEIGKLRRTELRKTI